VTPSPSTSRRSNGSLLESAGSLISTQAHQSHPQQWRAGDLDGSSACTPETHALRRRIPGLRARMPKKGV
jgi:hypothetical protein